LPQPLHERLALLLKEGLELLLNEVHMLVRLEHHTDILNENTNVTVHAYNRGDLIRDGTQKLTLLLLVKEAVR